MLSNLVGHDLHGSNQYVDKLFQHINHTNFIQ
jgi:hypothetical protein